MIGDRYKDKFDAGNLSHLTIAYMAGFFDGEGCVGICRTDKVGSFAIIARVTQKTTDILNMFRSNFKGRISQSKEHKRYWTPYWAISGRSCRFFFDAIEPYLIVKKEQVQLAISFHNHQMLQESHNKYYPTSNTELEFRKSQKELISKLKIKSANQSFPLLMPIHTYEEILSYLAGFFDGEGFIGIRREKSKGKRIGYHYRLACSANQKCRIPLDLLQSLFGGNFRVFKNKEKRKRDGLTSHFYVWSIHSRQAKVFLETILPFLIIKKEEAQIGINFQSGIKKDSGGMYGYLTDEQVAIRDAQVMLLSELKKKPQYSCPIEVGK